MCVFRVHRLATGIMVHRGRHSVHSVTVSLPWRCLVCVLGTGQVVGIVTAPIGLHENTRS